MPRSVALSIAFFAFFGFLAGLASLAGRGSLRTGSMEFTGSAALLVSTGIMALIGAAFGLIVLLLMRALKMAAENDPRWRK